MLPQSAPATPLDKNAQDFRRPLPAGEIAAIPIVGGLHHQYVRREVKSMLSARRAGTIAVIGAGEMGAAVAHQMLSKGARVLTTLKGRSAASAERVRLAGIEVVDDDDAIALEAGFLLSIVPPGQAIAVPGGFMDRWRARPKSRFSSSVMLSRQPPCGGLPMRSNRRAAS